MFTGIVETIGKINRLQKLSGNLHITVNSSISALLKIDQSLLHNGICLTIVEVKDDEHTVVAVEETLSRSNLGSLKVDARVNLERAMSANGRFDGHIVQGHVDQTAKCIALDQQDGSWLFTFDYDSQFANLLVEKGSVCIDGTSLTIARLTSETFSVAIIPYTFENTCFQYLKKGDTVNLEFDILGKYVERNMRFAAGK